MRRHTFRVNRLDRKLRVLYSNRHQRNSIQNLTRYDRSHDQRHVHMIMILDYSKLTCSFKFERNLGLWKSFWAFGPFAQLSVRKSRKNAQETHKSKWFQIWTLNSKLESQVETWKCTPTLLVRSTVHTCTYTSNLQVRPPSLRHHCNSFKTTSVHLKATTTPSTIHIHIQTLPHQD